MRFSLDLLVVMLSVVDDNNSLRRFGIVYSASPALLHQAKLVLQSSPYGITEFQFDSDLKYKVNSVTAWCFDQKDFTASRKQLQPLLSSAFTK